MGIKVEGVGGYCQTAEEEEEEKGTEVIQAYF